MERTALLPAAGAETGVAYTVRAPTELTPRMLARLPGIYLTPSRLGRSEFAVTAGYGEGPAIGIILAEEPWGEIGDQWRRDVPGALEIGGLFVHTHWRRTQISVRLIAAACTHALELGKTPVGVTEVGSPAADLLARQGALPRRRFRAGGVDYRPWVLTGMAA